MRVLQINSVCGIGSTGRIATDIHKMLTKQGHESFIAYGRDLPKNCGNTIKIGTKFDNYVHFAKTRILDKHGFGSKKSTIEFIKKVKDLDPDIIHLHNIHGYYINIEVLFNYLKEANKPVVWTLHDCWSFTGHCSHFDYVRCYKWKTSCKQCVQKKDYPTSIGFDRSKINYKKKKMLFTEIPDITLVVPSEWLGNLVEQSYFSMKDICVINNGIDLTVFRPTSSNLRQYYGLENKKVALAVASNWNDRKGLQDVIKLASILSDEWKIVIIGLSKIQKSEIIDSNIIGITRTNNINELVQWYSLADVFINPTYEDTFPTVNIEALACGTPVITYKTGGSPEIIDYTCGKVTRERNVQSLANSIMETDLSDYSVAACVERAGMFDCHKRFNEYSNLYIQKISGRKEK